MSTHNYYETKMKITSELYAIYLKVDLDCYYLEEDFIENQRNTYKKNNVQSVKEEQIEIKL